MFASLQIISDLKLIQENNQAVELLNIYKGAPFVCTGNILGIENDRVRVQVDSAQLVCLLNEQATKILGSDYFEPSTALVESIDLPSRVATLHQFSYLGTKLGERMLVRVEPKAPVPVLIETGERPSLSEMIDLSMTGIGLRLAPEQYRPILKAGAALRLTTTLPAGEIIMNGRVSSAVRRSAAYRLSVRFSADHTYKVIIFRYLVDRRKEIKAELQQAFENIGLAAPSVT